MAPPDSYPVHRDLRWAFENVTFEHVTVGDMVMTDPVYGVEEVVTRGLVSILTDGSTGVILDLRRPQRTTEIANGNDGVRRIVRFVSEPVLRVMQVEHETLREIQAQAERARVPVEV